MTANASYFIATFNRQEEVVEEVLPLCFATVTIKRTWQPRTSDTRTNTRGGHASENDDPNAYWEQGMSTAEHTKEKIAEVPRITRRREMGDVRTEAQGVRSMHAVVGM